VEFDFLPATHFSSFSRRSLWSICVWEFFERARLIAGAQPFSTWLLTAALVSHFLAFWASWHRFRLFSLHRPPKDGMSHPAISWPRVSFGVCQHLGFLFFIFICFGLQRGASERVEEETHVWDDFFLLYDG
jgi:hypothetical protein